MGAWHGLRVCAAASLLGGQCHCSSPRVLHSSVLWIARQQQAKAWELGAGCARIFTAEASGAQRDRPQLHAALDYLRPDDTLVVWNLDRLACSLCPRLDIVEALHCRQMGLRSLTDAIDTSTPGGTLVLSPPSVYTALVPLPMLS